MAARFVVGNPALAPLFAAVGAGIVGAGWFGFHTLKNNQEVMIARGTNPTPWNNVRQDQNTKASYISAHPLPTVHTPPSPHPCHPQNLLASDTYPDILIGSQLYSPNADFWKSRIGMPDPRSAFAATSGAVHDVAVKASAKVQEVKERALGRQ